jgi:putative two-component system response regulator
VADVYDALTSKRPYRRGMTSYEAREINAQGSGTEFDLTVVAAFLQAKRELEIPEVLVA